MKLFELLTLEEKRLGKRLPFSKGEIIFTEESRCEFVSIVLKGEVQITSYSLSGREIVYNIVRSNEMFGNNLLFSEKPFYRGNVIATKDSEILFFNKENFLKILSSNQAFLNAYLQMTADNSKKMNATIKILSLSSAEERLMFYLKDKESVKITSISSLARTLYLSRESLSRTISKMVKEKKIIKKGYILSLVK